MLPSLSLRHRISLNIATPQLSSLFAITPLFRLMLPAFIAIATIDAGLLPCRLITPYMLLSLFSSLSSLRLSLSRDAIYDGEYRVAILVISLLSAIHALPLVIFYMPYYEDMLTFFRRLTYAAAPFTSEHHMRYGDTSYVARHAPATRAVDKIYVADHYAYFTSLRAAIRY